MLRELIGQPPRVNEGLLADTFLCMNQTIQLLQKEIVASKDPSHDFRKLEIWCRGLLSSLDELEGCLFMAKFFRDQVVKESTEDMNEAEQMAYARYVFFYKDGFIRVFSILDKLGTVLNELFDLHTSKVKTHFSYFTVLRQFNYMKTHPELGNKLFAIKEQYKEALSELRRRRNTEIHYMNSEMKDDLWQRHQALYGKIKLEDLDGHLHDLQQGFKMVCESMFTSFSYSNQRFKTVSRHK